jgi:predicted GIY-YIG superfamily endonuclease
MKTKKCSKCGIDKPLNAKHYYRKSRNLTGFQCQCKVCANSYQKDRSEYFADYYKKNKQKYTEHDTKYYQENRDKILARNAEWSKKRDEKQPACVYQIINKINGKIYIGETTRAYRRRKEHFTSLKSNRHQNCKLQEDFNNFGEDAFEWSIIKELDKDKDILLLEEIRTIDNFLKQGKELYNLSLTIEQLQMLQEEK